MNIENIKVSDLIPYEYNTKIHDKKQVDNVAESIRRFGFVQPVVVDANNVIVIGHCRTLARKKLKMQTVPCVRVDDLTDEEIRLLRIADNKTNESPWDFENLNLELGDLDLSGFDFDFEIPSLNDETEAQEDKAGKEKETEEDDFEVTSKLEQRVKLGDIWKLGDHRLICGDSTDRLTLETLMDGKEADMVFTDPPYGMGKESDGVTNDNQNNDDLLEFNKKWIPLTFDLMKKNGSWYCWGIDEPLMDIYSNILKPMKKEKGEDKLTFRNLITWDKGSTFGQLSSEMRMYPVADEKCLFVMRGRQTYGDTKDDYWDGFEPIRLKLNKLLKDDLGLSISDVVECVGVTTCSHWFTQSQWTFPNEEHIEKLIAGLKRRDTKGANEYADNQEEYDKLRDEYAKTRDRYNNIREEYDKLRHEFYSTRAYFNNTHDNMNSVWHFERTSIKEREQTGGHATPKPIALCARGIKSSSREGEIVLDVFGGSGSTLIACEQLNRRCFMCELEPHWCDVIISRWEHYTGKKAELIERA